MLFFLQYVNILHSLNHIHNHALLTLEKVNHNNLLPGTLFFVAVCLFLFFEKS